MHAHTHARRVRCTSRCQEMVSHGQVEQGGPSKRWGFHFSFIFSSSKFTYTNILISHLKTNRKPQLLKLLGNAGQV